MYELKAIIRNFYNVLFKIFKKIQNIKFPTFILSSQ